MDFLWLSYFDIQRGDPEDIKQGFRALDRFFEGKSLEGVQYVFDIVCNLCLAYEMLASVNFETATWRDIKAAKSHAGVRGFCMAFETAIRFLLPQAGCWTDDQWLDEEILFSSLQTAFRKDWRRDPFAFDGMIAMLMDKLYYKDPKYLARLLSIKRLPASVIKHIWPMVYADMAV